MTQIFGKQFVPNLPVLNPSDRRLNPMRDGWDNDREISAPSKICKPVVDLKSAPSANAGTDHQLLMGEEIQILSDDGDYLWVQSCVDHYVGYILKQEADENLSEPTHIVVTPRTFIYPEAELRKPPLAALSMGSRVKINGSTELRGTSYALLEDGSAIIEKHLCPVGVWQDDYVSVAESLLNTPYLWGGSSGFGIDCSSLVQLSLRLCGRSELRDSDMQAAQLGDVIDPGEDCQNLVRGDLIFWKGHVAICCGKGNGEIEIIHASGHTMSVAREPLREAIDRIAYLYEMPIGFRRP